MDKVERLIQDGYVPHIKTQVQFMKPWTSDMAIRGDVSISEADRLNGSPKEGDMIAINVDDPSDKWLIAAEFFKKNYGRVDDPTKVGVASLKTYHNTDASKAKANVKDIKFYGDGDAWKLLGKASSQAEGWMKSTKVMPVSPLGCIVQVTTQQGDNVAEATQFIPDAVLYEVRGNNGEVVRRQLGGTLPEGTRMKNSQEPNFIVLHLND